MGKNVLQICHLRQNRRQFVFNLCPFQSGQLAQSHGHNGSGLRVGQTKPLNQCRFCRRLIFGSTDDLDHFVNIVQRNFKPF